MKYIVYILVFIAFCLGFVFVYQSNINDKKESELFKQDYPLLEAINTRPIRSVVASIKQSTNQYYRGGYLIDLKNSEKFTLPASTRNYLYNPYDIRNFLQRNDSIYKPAECDSIYIYRNGKEYYFIIGEVLNKELKK